MQLPRYLQAMEDLKRVENTSGWLQLTCLSRWMKAVRKPQLLQIADLMRALIQDGNAHLLDRLLCARLKIL